MSDNLEQSALLSFDSMSSDAGWYTSLGLDVWIFVMLHFSGKWDLCSSCETNGCILEQSILLFGHHRSFFQKPHSLPLRLFQINGIICLFSHHVT